MRQFWVGTVCVGVVLWIAGCADTKTNANPVPVPSPVNPPVTPLPTPTPSIDPRIPDLSRAVPVALTDRTGLTALKDLARNVFPPLVGDVLLQLTLTKTRDQNILGKVLFAFEDQYGFWGAELSSFANTGTQSDSLVDIIFADDELVLRLVASRSVDDLNGLLYYRIRQSGDITCRDTFVTCEVWGYPPYPAPPYCLVQSDPTNDCRSYMNLSNSSVKSVGSFKAKFSNWAVGSGT